MILLVVASSLGLLALMTPAGAAGAPSSTGSSSGAHPAQTPPTHGDLVVGPGQTYVIQPTSAGLTYYQGGNITVEAGGTLNVTNVTLSFAQYVSNIGTPMQRLSHIYQFVDEGTVNFYHANLTTDVNVINAYAKLNFSVMGVLNAQASTFAFPGWFYIDGSAAKVTLNESAITGNPAVVPLEGFEPAPIWGDTVWAPTVTVLGGAQLNLFASTVNETYADPLAFVGYPRPVPLSSDGGVLTGAGLSSSLTTSNTPESLAQDWSYPDAGALSGTVQVNYTDSNSVTNTLATLAVSYGGVSYTIGGVAFVNGSSTSILLPLSASLLGNITAQGMLQYLNYTGAFGTSPQILVQFSGVSGPSVNLTGISVQVNTTGPEFNLTVSGAGSVLSAIDSSIDVNWTTVGGGLYSETPPFAWDSNKLVFTDGALGYLGNVSSTTGVVNVFSTSAILEDSASQVYLYRWAQVNITSTPDRPLQGAQLSMYYAYGSDQANNATVTAINDIATVNPAMWGYLEYWDGAHGAAGWGVSNAEGDAALLVASNELTYQTLPDGNFLGGYHVGVSVPGFTVPSHWFNWSVSPYPQGVASGTAGYARPDYAPAQGFPNFVFTIRVTSASPPSSATLSLSGHYFTAGTVAFNGTATATIEVYATPTGGGNAIPLGTGTAAANSAFNVTWYSLNNVLSAGSSYTLSVTATANGVTSEPYLIQGTYTVSGGPSHNFFTQTFLGLPVWLWLAIAAAAVVAIVAFLLIARRQAAGKLVECGECGNLIPEEATVCPKCGAEFESDLIRCSRCASTIPADSKFCPECAAQLLGKPGEAESDPEKQAYADFTGKYRAEAKRELGDNYTEGAFWDWWKRQPTYTPFSQWSLQQGQGTARAGMTAPPAGTETAPETPPAKPPKGGAPPSTGRKEPGAAAAPSTAAAPPTTTTTVPPPATGAGTLKACPSCGKEIPAEYLVCPFCNAVTQ